MQDNQSRAVMQRERMRLGQVRKSFAAAIERHATGTAISPEFFATCVDYIKASMDRLHDQDQRIYDILKPQVDAGDAAGHAVLEDLNARLARSRAALAALPTARDVFRAQGTPGWERFKRAVDAFMDVYFNVLLKGQHATLEMQKRLFSERDWEDVAGISQDSRVTEAALFAAVKRQAPSGADPDGFKAGPPVA